MTVKPKMDVVSDQSFARKQICHPSSRLQAILINYDIEIFITLSNIAPFEINTFTFIHFLFSKINSLGKKKKRNVV